MFLPWRKHCLLLPWLLLFDIPGLRTGFRELIAIMNLFHASPQSDRKGINPRFLMEPLHEARLDSKLSRSYATYNVMYLSHHERGGFLWA